MAMGVVMQIYRTSTANNPPAANSLQPGQLAVEMATVPPNLWCGVPTTINANGQILLNGNSSGPTPPATPNTGDVWFDSTTSTLMVWNGTAWQGTLPLPVGVANGGTGTGTAPTANQILIAQSATAYAPVTLNGDATLNAAGSLTVTSVNGTAGPFAPLTNPSGGQNNYAPLASPTFTGVPAGPTATAGTNTTQLATTAFVATSFAPLASPALTGTPSAPTATAGTSTSQIATTAFVTSALGNFAPLTNPSGGQNNYAPLTSPALNGTPTAPTATAGTNTTQLATTAFVTSAVAGIGAGYLPLSGGTLTGPLTLSGNATTGLQPVTLQQLNSTLTSYLPLTGGTLTGLLTLSGNATAQLNAVPLQQLTSTVAGYLPLAGGTMTGALTLSGNATANLQPVTLQQMNSAIGGAFAPLTNPTNGQNNYAPLASPTFSGTVTLPGGSGAGGTVTSSGYFGATQFGFGTLVPGASWGPAQPPLGQGAGYAGQLFLVDVLNPSSGTGVPCLVFQGNGFTADGVIQHATGTTGYIHYTYGAYQSPLGTWNATANNATIVIMGPATTGAAQFGISLNNGLTVGNTFTTVSNQFTLTASLATHTTPVLISSTVGGTPPLIVNGTAASPLFALSAAAQVLAGCYNNGSNWIATNQNAQIVGLSGGGTSSTTGLIQFNANNSLTVGNAFTPTLVMSIGPTGVAIIPNISASGNITLTTAGLSFVAGSSTLSSNGLAYGGGAAAGLNWVPGTMTLFTNGTNNNTFLVTSQLVSGSQFGVSQLALNTTQTAMFATVATTTSQVSWGVTASDRRIKRNLVAAGDALSIVNALPVYTGDQIIPTTGELAMHLDYTLIADEVQKLLPSAYLEPANDSSYAGLHPLYLITALWRAVQQLSERLTAVERGN